MELIFTYGTLMKDRSAHNSFQNMSYVTDTILSDYGLYEASDNNYPCAVPVEGFKVYGEIYSLDKNTLDRLDQYEEEGELYIRKKVIVVTEENKEVNVWFYEYIQDVKNMQLRAPCGKWLAVKEPADNYSWYVCYGSNLLRERFDYYLKKSEGTVYAEKSLILDGKLYFAKKARRWDNKAVAFANFDSKNNKVFCYAYLLKNEQIDIISDLEGKSWYPKQYLGKDSYGIDMYTVNGQHTDINKPSHDYLEIIAAGLKCRLSLSDAEIKEYLDTNDSFNYEREHILEVLNRHCA